MDASQVRKRMQQGQCEIDELLEVLEQRHKFIRGRVYNLRRRCGKTTCRCQTGALHSSWVLAFPEQGHKRMRTVPEDKRILWQRMTERYRRFRRARVKLVKLFAQIVRLVAALEQKRTVPPSE